MYPAIHSQPAYAEHNGRGAEFPVSSHVAARGLWLPSSSKLSDADVTRVCDAIKEFFSGPGAAAAIAMAPCPAARL